MIILAPIFINSTFMYRGNIELPITAGTGYSWFISKKSSDKINAKLLRNIFPPNIVGAKGKSTWQITIFPDYSEQTYKLTFIKKRPWLDEIVDRTEIVCHLGVYNVSCQNFTAIPGKTFPTT